MAEKLPFVFEGCRPQDCVHSEFERDGNCHYYMCFMHPEKLYGVCEEDCIKCKWRVVSKETGCETICAACVKKGIGCGLEPGEMVVACTAYKKVIRTNADRIRAMSDEELAYRLAVNECGICPLKEKCFSMEPIRDCEDMWLDWLKQEVEDG